MFDKRKFIMNQTKVILTLMLLIFIYNSNAAPLTDAIKTEHFRFENFQQDRRKNIEYVYLMCHRKKVTPYIYAKQMLAGDHNLWVRATSSRRGVKNSIKEAIVNFKVNLAAGKNYQLNREKKDGKIAIWIQDIETGEIVSDVIKTKLKIRLIVDERLRRKQCQSGSV